MSDVADAGQIPSPVTVPGVAVKGPMREEYDRVLSGDALAFIARPGAPLRLRAPQAAGSARRTSGAT